MGAMQWQHWVIILVVVLLLFGTARLPGLAKSVGQSMKIFKKEIKDLRDDNSDDGDRRAADGNAENNRPGGTTTSSPSSTTGPGASSGTDDVPGLINNRDRDIPKA